MIIKRRKRRNPLRNFSQLICSRDGLNPYLESVSMMMKLELSMKKSMEKNLRTLSRHTKYLRSLIG